MPSEAELQSHEQAAQATWQSMLAHYGDFEHSKGWEHIKPFRQFVAQIAASPYGARLFASPSHEILCISSVATYSERLMHPMVAVYPRKNGHIKVEYWIRQHKRSEKAECPLEAAWDTLKPMLEQLITST